MQLASGIALLPFHWEKNHLRGQRLHDARGFRDGRVAGECRERRSKRVSRKEDIVRPLFRHRDAQMDLICGKDLRDFHKERLPGIEHMRAANFQRIVADAAGMQHGKFRRAVRRAVAIVPALRKMAGWRGCDAGSERRVEAQQHTIVPRFKTNWQRRAAGETHTMKTAVQRRVRSPALHAAHVEMSVARAESAALHAGIKVAGDPHCGCLPSLVHLLPHHEPRAAGSA